MGGAWPSGEAYNSTLDKKRNWIGTGLLLDGSEGPIDANRIYVTEIVGCERGVHLRGACTHNAIEATTIHLSKNHVQLGDEGATPSQVRANRIAAHMEAQGIAGAIGASIAGAENILTLSSSGMAPDGDIVFGKQSERNLVTIASLAGFTNRALKPTNRIVSASSQQLTITPAIPPSGVGIVNRYPWAVGVCILAPGKVDRWTEAMGSGQTLSFAGPLASGQTILLNPGDQLTFDYSVQPTWTWKALQ